MSEPRLDQQEANALLSTIDAAKWASAFVRVFPTMDEGSMLAWFANAIMTGYDEATRRAQADPWEPLTDAHKDGELWLLWCGTYSVVGRWVADRWEDVFGVEHHATHARRPLDGPKETI